MIYLIKTGVLPLLVIVYVHPSRNSRQLIFSRNAVILILIYVICYCLPLLPSYSGQPKKRCWVFSKPPQLLTIFLRYKSAFKVLHCIHEDLSVCYNSLCLVFEQHDYAVACLCMHCAYDQILVMVWVLSVAANYLTTTTQSSLEMLWLVAPLNHCLWRGLFLRP